MHAGQQVTTTRQASKVAMVSLDNCAPDSTPLIPEVESNGTMDVDEAQRDATVIQPPLQERTFAESNYKRFSVAAQAAASQQDLFADVHKMLTLFATRTNPWVSEEVIAEGVHSFMAKIRTEAFEQMSMEKDLQHDVDAVAEYLWTSGRKHALTKGLELCSVLNAVIRDDVEGEIEAASSICWCINNRRRLLSTSKGSALVHLSYPPNGETWRGGGFRNRFRPFFECIKGKKYRVPGFLATSNQRSVASTFAFNADKHHAHALWRVTFDRRGKNSAQHRVQHVWFVCKTFIPGEGEYLFEPYSVFTLVSVKWSPDPRKSHKFTIRAAVDNKRESENLPLAPWY